MWESLHYCDPAHFARGTTSGHSSLRINFLGFNLDGYSMISSTAKSYHWMQGGYKTIWCMLRKLTAKRLLGNQHPVTMYQSGTLKVFSPRKQQLLSQQCAQIRNNLEIILNLFLECLTKMFLLFRVGRCGGGGDFVRKSFSPRTNFNSTQNLSLKTCSLFFYFCKCLFICLFVFCQL